MADQPKTLENLLTEDRVFPPTDEFAAAANAKPDLYEKADADYLGFWKEQALNRVTWFKEPTVVLDDSNPPFFKWFSDGELNVSYNCLDRHLEDKGDKVAFHWVGEPGDTQDITFRDLHERVGKLANPFVQIAVSDVLGVARLANPVEGNLVADGVEMTVEAVVRNVELAVTEPLEERGIRVIQNDRRLLEPRDAVERLFLPEAQVVGISLLVHVGFGICGRGEFFSRREYAVLGE